MPTHIEKSHSHIWIDPEDPPISRMPYSPIIGDRRREMKAGRIYKCRECTAITVIPKESRNENRISDL